jgi:hypothetical protein
MKTGAAASWQRPAPKQKIDVARVRIMRGGGEE